MNFKGNKLIMITVALMGVVNISFANSEHEAELVHIHEPSREHIHGSHMECPLPNSRENIVSCALNFHPNSVRKGEMLEVAGQLIDKASQIPNPNLTTRYVKGSNLGVEVSELEANLAFVLELGGKRGARMEYAEASKKEVSVHLEAVKTQIKMQTIFNLHRLRQIREEKQLLHEGMEAFSKIITKLKRLKRLSAEQQAALTLFEIAYEDVKIQDSINYEEERELEHFFHVATGHSLDEIKDLLPPSPKSWPEIERNLDKQEDSPRIKRLKSLSEVAVGELRIQESQAWPDLKVGPSFAIEKEGLVENRMIGFNIQLPLPFFNVNGGGKAHARRKLLSVKKDISLTRSEENHERLEQLRIYESTLRILKKTMRKELVEKKHRQVEKLYLRGVVSSSIFLDSFKQKLNYIRHRNKREMTAIRALWEIYKFDGKVLKEKV